MNVIPHKQAQPAQPAPPGRPSPSPSPAPAPAQATGGAGRSCPLHYRYRPAVFDSAAAFQCEALYVVGGLYGNEQALAAVLQLFEREPLPLGRKRLVFNGDFNWFNITPDAFERINRTVLGHHATRGNVETELCTNDAWDGLDAGCGCAYPDWVGNDTVSWSNQIMHSLRATAQGQAAIKAQLAALPMWLRVDVGEATRSVQRVAVVHGDAQSLAGWGFAQEVIAANPEQLSDWFDAAQVDVFASSHTCLPVFYRQWGQGRGSRPGAGPGAGAVPLSLPLRAHRGTMQTVLNNGAAGMPNARATATQPGHGIVTRIATRPFDGPQRLFGFTQGGLHMDALAVVYDHRQFASDFLAQWPPGSAAHRSYWQRIDQGPGFDLQSAVMDHCDGA